MKYWTLTLAGIKANRIRTILTIGSIAISFLLFGILQGINSSANSTATNVQASQLFVANKISDTELLPLAALAEIRAVPGVKDATFQVLMPGYFKDPRNPTIGVATEVQSFFRVHNELVVTDRGLEQMAGDKMGILVGANLAKRMAWKIGDQIHIRSTSWLRSDGTYDWPFKIAGLVSDQAGRFNILLNNFILNYSYLDDSRLMFKGQVGVFLIKVRNPDDASKISSEIDNRFRNSSFPTRTQTLQEFALSSLRQIGDLQSLLRAILGAVCFTLLIVTGNTMMQSIRSQLPDFAILKSIGYSDGLLSAIIFLQSAAIYLFSALLGLGLSSIIFPLVSTSFGIPNFPFNVFILGISISLFLSVVSGFPAAIKMRNSSIIDVLKIR